MKLSHLVPVTLLFAQALLAAEPRTLEEALLNHAWEWTHAPKPPDILTFNKNGIASCRRFAWKWKITGKTTVAAYDAVSEGIDLPDFKAELKFDPSFRTLEASTLNGKNHFTGKRITASASAVEALRRAVTSTIWTWKVLLPHPDPWDERRFDANGSTTAWRRGELMCSGTWEILGPLTLRIQNLSTQKNVQVLNFTTDLTSFEGVDHTGRNYYSGTRKTDASTQFSFGTSSLTTIQTDSNQPRIEIVKEQGPNAAEWALTPLEEAIPADIRQNLTFLREDLLDEAVKSARSSPEAYKLASDYCDKLLAALSQREIARSLAGYQSAQADAGKRTSNQALDARRNHQMSWPQFSREESQRAALRDNESAKADVKKQRLKLEWTARAEQMRTVLDSTYRQLREALR